MTYGFATPFASSQEHPEPDFYKAVRDAGFDFIELPGTLIQHIGEEDFKKLADCLKALSLETRGICSLFPGSLRFFEVGGEEIEAYIDRAFARFRLLGAGKIGFGSGAARRLPEGMGREEGMERFAERVRKHIVPYLEKYDFEMVIEPFNPQEANFILTAADGAEAAQRIGSPRIGILTDTLHMIGSGEDPERVAREQASFIRHIHISEPARVLPVREYSPACMACIKALKSTGYDGSISFETACPDVRELGPALALLKSVWES